MSIEGTWSMSGSFSGHTCVGGQSSRGHSGPYACHTASPTALSAPMQTCQQTAVLLLICLCPCIATASHRMCHLGERSSCIALQHRAPDHVPMRLTSSPCQSAWLPAARCAMRDCGAAQAHETAHSPSVQCAAHCVRACAMIHACASAQRRTTSAEQEPTCAISRTAAVYGHSPSWWSMTSATCSANASCCARVKWL